MSPNDGLPSMYGEFADWFHLLTSPAEYDVEADYYARAMTEAATIPVETVLELGSGGGNNASHLKDRFSLTLVDLSEGMLELSRSLNPECEHIQGDMRTLRLGRQFDAVFVHDAIDYMTTQEDLASALLTAFQHCRPGGAATFAPDHLKDTFTETTDHGGHDGEGRSLRYLEWTWDPDPNDDVYLADYAFLLREADGSVRAAHDRHTCGLFTRATWIEAIEGAGFEVQVLPGIEGDTPPETFVGRRPL